MTLKTNDHAHCLFCTREGRRLAESSVSFLGKNLSQKTAYYFCPSCELIYQSPLPPLQDIDADANEGSYEDFCKKEDPSLGFRRRNMQLYYEAIRDKIDIREKTVLEIGGGGGHHLALLKEKGARNLLGIELSRNGIRYAQERYGFNMMTESFVWLNDASLDDVF